MFECEYKFTLEDALTCSKYVYKSGRRKQDKILSIMIPMLIGLMIAMLVFDIVRRNSLVWDIALLVALIVLEIMNLMMPVLVIKSQKKAFYNADLDKMDSLVIEIKDNTVTERMIQNGEEKVKNSHNLKHLTSFIEDNDYLILVYNNVEFTCIKKFALKGNLTGLKSLLQKAMSKQAK